MRLEAQRQAKQAAAPIERPCTENPCSERAQQAAQSERPSSVPDLHVPEWGQRKRFRTSIDRDTYILDLRPRSARSSTRARARTRARAHTHKKRTFAWWRRRHRHTKTHVDTLRTAQCAKRELRDELVTDPQTGVAPGIPEAAICVQDVDDQCVLQFTLVHAAGCALHRRESRVIHRWELWRLLSSDSCNTGARGKCVRGTVNACERTRVVWGDP